MKIRSIKHPQNLGGDGLAALNLDRLPRIVVVAGANGSGKTRLIKRIGSLHGCDQNPGIAERKAVEGPVLKILAEANGYDSADKAFGSVEASSHCSSLRWRSMLKKLH